MQPEHNKNFVVCVQPELKNWAFSLDSVVSVGQPGQKPVDDPFSTSVNVFGLYFFIFSSFV
jgi:hypothetical protein